MCESAKLLAEKAHLYVLGDRMNGAKPSGAGRDLGALARVAVGAGARDLSPHPFAR
jgi:hypothetical protein